MCQPPGLEQLEISRTVANLDSDYAKAIEIIEAEMRMLREYVVTLVSETVTGKIKL